MIIPINLLRKNEDLLIGHLTTNTAAAAAATTAAGAVAAAGDGAFVAEPDCEAESFCERGGQSESEQGEGEEVVVDWRSGGTHACWCSYCWCCA